MKRFIMIPALILAVAVAYAADELSTITVTNKISTTTSNTTKQKFTGFLDSVWLSAGGNTTGTLTIASALTGEKFLDAAVTGSGSFRPRVIPMWTNGIAASIGTNLLERAKIVEESLTFTFTETHKVTNSHTIYIRISDK